MANRDFSDSVKLSTIMENLRNNNGEIQQLKVGEIFKPSINSNSYIKDVTHFYYTLEDALYAPFDT